MLVGRAGEQRRLSALVSAARIGQSAVLVLTGEGGIGKTTLLEHVVSEATGMRVLRVTGSDAEQPLPFAALGQLLRLAPVDLDALPPPQAQALGVALALREGPAVDRFAVAAAALTLLTQLSEDQPLAVLVDDAQLVDQPTQEVLAFVARRLLADAIVLVVAVRTGEPSALLAPDLPRLELQGLDHAATAALLGVHGASVDDIFELSGGNPLAVLELARHPERWSALWPGAAGLVPDTLVRLYAHRAASLGPAARTAVLLAATAGDDLVLVARACAVRGVGLADLAEAEQTGLVSIEEDRVRFAHPLVRSALYSTATPAERRLLHATVAEVTSTGDRDRRAWHLSEAALGPDEAAAAAMRGLGQRATLRGAFAVSATAYERAARHAVDDGDRSHQLVRAGEAAWRAGDAHRATALLERSLALQVSAKARRLLGVIELRAGSLLHARSTLVAAAQACRDDPPEAVVCWGEVVNACFYLADPDGALVAAEQLEDLLARGLPERSAVLASIAAGLAQVLAGSGGLDLVRRGLQLRAALEPPAEDDDHAAWFLIGPLLLRESGSGRDVVRAAVDDRRGRSAVGTLPRLLFLIARDEATTDRWVQAEADYTEAISLAGELGQTTERAMSTAGLAWLLARQGRAEEAARQVAEAARLGVTHQVQLARVWAGHAAGDLAYGRGEVERAIDSYVELEGLIAELGLRDVDLSPTPELVEALLSAGREAAAAERAALFHARAAAKGQPWALARSARVRGLLGPAGEVDRCFTEALALHTVTPDCFEQARTELAYGARLRRQRRRVDARPHLQRALAEFSRLGALPWADRAADELNATGATALRAGAQLTRQLTPRELQIALLLADGRTIREAAAALFLSPKTVEYHLRHVYTKFGIESRTQLAELMQA